jgi:hypothetical protein
VDLRIELNFSSDLDEGVFADIVEGLSAGGAKVAVKRRPPEGPYASLEWLIPTAVIVLLGPYLAEFSKETGKLHANALHGGLAKLYRKVLGPEPEITCTIIGTPGKAGTKVFSAAVSVRMARNDGGQAVLLFPTVTSSEDFSLAVDLFTELMSEHYALNGADPLTRAMALIPYLNSPQYQVLVYMNPEAKELELIDYVESSRSRKLTTRRIRG